MIDKKVRGAGHMCPTCMRQRAARCADLLLLCWSFAVWAGGTDPLIVSQDHAWPPFSFVDNQGEPAGILIELWEEIGERLGRPVEFRLADWPDSIAQVRSGEAQVHGGLIDSRERRAFFDFSEPLLPLAAFVFVHAGSTATSVSEVSVGTVGVIEGSYEAEFMQQNFPAVEVAPYKNNELMVIAAVRGEIPAFVADYPVGMYLLDRHATPADFRVLQSLYARELMIGVPRGNTEMLAQLNAVVAELDADELARLTSRWLRVEQVTVVPVWLVPALLAALGGTALLFLGSYIYLLVGQRQRLERSVRARTSELNRSEAKFRALVENASDNIYSLSPDGVITYASPNWSENLGDEAEDVIGTNISDYVHPEDLERCYQFLRLVLTSSSKQQGIEYRIRHRSGEWRWHVSNGSPQLDEDGNVVGYLGIARDVTERRQAEDQLRHLAHHDALTGLPNRALFSDRLQQALKGAARHGTSGALMVLDLDDFKIINDTHGHVAGDVILQQAARRVQDCLRASDTVGRIGGDEFVVLLQTVSVREDAVAVAEKICARMAEPFHAEGLRIHVSVSIGIAIFPADADSQTSLLACADSAMYTAKRSAATRIAVYDAAAQGRRPAAHREAVPSD